MELQACQVLREVVGWDRIAVVLARDADTRTALRGSDADLEHYCDLQQTLVQGPSLDAFTYGIPVVVDDLRGAPLPWPLLASTTPADLPVRSLAVVPLPKPSSSTTSTAGRPNSEPAPPALGVLIVGRDHHDPFTTTQVSALTHLAGVISALVVHRASTGQLVEADTDPSDELSVVVGMLQERSGADAHTAMDRMRLYAFGAGCTIHDLARAVLSGQTELGDITDFAS